MGEDPGPTGYLLGHYWLTSKEKHLLRVCTEGREG